MEVIGLKINLNFLVAALILLIGLIRLYYFLIDRTIRELGDQDSLPYYYRLLSPTNISDLYHSILSKALDKAKLIFGKPFSLRALSTCLLLAFVYPLLLFLFTWAFFGVYQIGNQSVMPSDWPHLYRLLFIIGLVFWFYTSAEVAKRADKFTYWLDRTLEHLFEFKVWKSFGSSLSNLERRKLIAPLIGIAIGLSLYILGASIRTALLFGTILSAPVAFVDDFPGSDQIVFGMLFGGLFLLLPSDFNAGIFAVFSVITLLAIYPVAPDKVIFFDKRYAYLIFLLLIGISPLFFSEASNQAKPTSDNWTATFFLLALPLINGVLDFFSWAVSRTLGRLMIKLSWLWALVFIIVDLLVAFLILVGLTWTLSFAARIHSIDINQLLNQVFAEPFEAGLWIVVMLASTLIPTVIHICFAIISLCTIKQSSAGSKWREQLEAQIKKFKPPMSLVERRKLANYLARHRGVTVTIIALIVFVAILYLIIESNFIEILRLVAESEIKIPSSP
ncbi:hypothetical protein NC796_09460 [Aliifodinibius sp. S!AR15-10]|uniref:hypothetical protein n=1 Tax=Aliifodinibius sp. S!AR15-10 TaxID=2950437 RepID=UPI00285965D1|nr:hypothetical protein [Aliifodinibius sp. S!AR15-10]MDR8391364.1 hypothetical protein [Aliifodinibius sp. S!AR15-10]